MSSRDFRKLGGLLLPVLLLAALLIFLSKGSKSPERSAPVQENKTKESSSLAQEPASLGALVTNKPGQYQPRFTLLPAVGTAKVLLLNASGDVVHEWPQDAMRARLLPNCNLVLIHGSKWGAREEPWRSLRTRVREFSWEGELLWEYETAEKVHHDLQRLDNGNTLFPVFSYIPEELKATIEIPQRRALKIRSDEILEVNEQGEVLWNWLAHEHIDLNDCGRSACTKRGTDWTHINTVQVVPENPWFSSGDTRFKPGNLIVLPRNFSQVMIIDKETKEVVWRYAGDYRGGLSGGHEAHMIAAGLPGAGNMLIFDNGRVQHEGESILLEINPSTKDLVWKYEDGKNFFTASAGSMQRLPDGNTFVSGGVSGRAFEVTASGEVVWEYKSNYRLARAKRYADNYCSELSKLKL